MKKDAMNQELQFLGDMNMSEIFPDLNRLLDEEEEKKKAEKEALKSKSNGFRLFGRKK